MKTGRVDLPDGFLATEAGPENDALVQHFLDMRNEATPLREGDKVAEY
jgi:hypothetical protein